MEQLSLKRLSEEDYLLNPNEKGVYVHIDTPQMYCKNEDGAFNKSEFYSNPQLYRSNLEQYTQSANLYIAAHLWNAKNPILLPQKFFQMNSGCSVVADISCDLNGPIACTIRASKIADPVYGYNPATGEETTFSNENAVAVMAIDNLPCELPKDASEDFGNEIMKQIIPRMVLEDDGILCSGRETTKDGKLTPAFEYLTDYVTGH
jgi:alanine dehydrogenase